MGESETNHGERNITFFVTECAPVTGDTTRYAVEVCLPFRDIRLFKIG